jgi:hypothetical protein
MFPQQKVVGRGLFLRASTRPSRSPYCSGDTLRVHLCDALFLSHHLDLLEARLSSLQAPRPTPQWLDVRLRPLLGGFSFLDPRSPYATSSTPCLHSISTWLRLCRFAYTSIGGLWDMGTHGSPPTRVPEVPVKWTRPAKSPADLQVGPETLSTIPATLEDLRRPQIVDDLLGLRGKPLPGSRWRRRQ